MYGSRKEAGFFSTTPEDGKGATADPWQCTTVLTPHVAWRTLPRVAQKAWESGHANKIMIKWTCQKLKVLEESHFKKIQKALHLRLLATLFPNSFLVVSAFTTGSFSIGPVLGQETKGYGV